MDRERQYFGVSSFLGCPECDDFGLPGGCPNCHLESKQRVIDGVGYTLLARGPKSSAKIAEYAELAMCGARVWTEFDPDNSTGMMVSVAVWIATEDVMLAKKAGLC